WQLFFSTDYPGDRASAGTGHDWTSGATMTPVDVALFSFRPSDQPLFSIGQLQQANLSLIDAYPAYPVGNSLADFRLALNALSSSTPVQVAELTTKQNVYYDNSWLLNRAVWDRYFFSTVPVGYSVPANGTPPPLPNPRHRIIDSAANIGSPDLAAASLLVSGGFNINSTSEQAWRAILAGNNQLGYNPATGAEPANSPTAFSRFWHPGNNTDTESPWEGYRTLTPFQIAQLARNIVAEIRTRGPFVSLGDFVNRRLVDNAAAANNPIDRRLKGAIQAALDATTTTAGGAYPVNDATLATSFLGSDPIINGVTSGQPYLLNNIRGRTAQAVLNSPTVSPYSGRSAFAPKFITQADILSTIGASLSARSDTFTIRTYGESINPVTGDSIGKAWCEAVVQRFPDYINSSANTADAPASSLSGDNKYFGRKFQIISFRWLTPSEI
ncbi:MAG TPA: hypothetical protein VK968_14785, partial [Roseimicrobium sp.]|nr:hypothetical protein [Roseimicrobium sp.]